MPTHATIQRFSIGLWGALAFSACPAVGAETSSQRVSAAPRAQVQVDAGGLRLAPPGVDQAIELPEGFTATAAPAPRQLGPEVINLGWVRYQRGNFQMWHASEVPIADLHRLLRAARQNAGDRLTVLEWGKNPGLDHIAEVVDNEGRVRKTLQLSASTALTARSAMLEKRAHNSATVLENALLERAGDVTRDDVARVRALAPSVVKRELAQTPVPRSSRPLDSAVDNAAYAAGIAKMNQERIGLGAEPVTFGSLAAFVAPETEVVMFLPSSDDLRPEPEELAAVLSSWRLRFGARMAFTTDSIKFEVTHPPTKPADVRRVTLEFYLMCPVAESGWSSHRPSATELIAQVTSRSWECLWFVE